jgi:hypothetical protein
MIAIVPSVMRYHAPYIASNSSASTHNYLILLVPGEGIEPPTFGLQNRCSTAELTRPYVHLQ